MIHDKDYIIRIVKQFSEFLAKQLLEKNEGKLSPELQTVFETGMSDSFKMDFDTLAQKNIEEIDAWVAGKDEAHQLPYLELLGHLFYFKFKDGGDEDRARAAHHYYSEYLRRSGIFSLPVMARVNELKAFT